LTGAAQAGRSKQGDAPQNWRLCIAPMLDWTDRFDRYFLRLISRRARLYTEMVTSAALLHGDARKLLRFDAAEHPIALQLGGSDPAHMARCAKLAESCGYDEVNINVGCPSDRVQRGTFGACLMARPQRVADCVAAMRAAVSIPVTVKTRIGIDRQDSYQPFADFVDVVAAAGCEVFIVHARKAWLDGLSPKENREIPPLRYDFVQRLKRERAELTIVVNGGLDNWRKVDEQLAAVDGAMLGRAAYQNPYLLAEADARLFGDPRPPRSRAQVLEDFLPFVEAQLAEGVPLGHISRHILGLFHGQPGARAWRRHISEQAHRPGAGTQVLREALARVI